MVLYVASYCKRKYGKLSLQSAFLARIEGMLSYAPWYSAIFTHFFISLNRFSLFKYPVWYNRLWSVKKAFAIGISIYFFGILISIPAFFDECGKILKKALNYQLTYQQTACGTIWLDAEALMTILLISVMGCLDFVAYFKYLAHRKAIKINSFVPNNSIIKQRDIVFLKQTCIGGLLLIGSTVLWHITSYWFQENWFFFELNIFLAFLIDSMDGFILLIYNWRAIFGGNGTVHAISAH